MTDKNTYDALEIKLWKTKKIRFTADEWLRAKNKWSTFSISILSFYLIVLSVLSFSEFDLINHSYIKYVPAIALLISVYILILSLFEGAKNYSLEADKMHRCALEIQAQYHKLLNAKNSNSLSAAIKGDILKEYDSILLRYPNHDETYFEVFKAKNYKEDNVQIGPSECVFIKAIFAAYQICVQSIRNFWLYAFLVFSPLIIFLTDFFVLPPK